MKKLPILCPSCDHSLAVSQLSCTSCETKISGNYSLPSLLQLQQDDQEFIFQFILTGGSLKKMASMIQKSYPTVRNKLDDIINKIEKMQNKEL